MSYVVSVDFIFFGLTGAALFVFRRRDPGQAVAFKAPLHPLTTGLFVIACAVTVIATVWNNPTNSLIGYAILAAGSPGVPLLATQEPGTFRMRAMKSDYMHWAKFKRPYAMR